MRDLTCSAHQRRAARVLLPAAEVAASALATAGYDAHVAGLAGDAEPSPVQAAVDDDAAADAGADRQAHEVRFFVARAVAELPPRRRIGVVLNDDVAVEPL